ncbi:hypothetical protein, partial [Lysinibacillus sphaericus]
MPYNMPSYEKQQEIKTTVDDIKNTTNLTKTSVDQVKQDVANANTKLDKLGNTGGTAIFDTNGSYSWTCPDGVRKVWLTI